MKMCACGCGLEVKNKNKNFVKGHNSLKGKPGRPQTPEWKAMMLKIHLGKPRSEETKEKLRKANLGKKQSAETVAKRVSKVKGKPKPKKSEQMMGNTLALGKRWTLTEEQRARKAIINRALWRRLDYAKKVFKGLNLKPNKQELKLQDILDIQHPKEWKYVGNGELIIGGRCPDFANTNGKKTLIELFGDYWHRNDNPQDRINHFKQYGYSTLVIWENELKDTNKLLSKISLFMGVAYPKKVGGRYR